MDLIGPLPETESGNRFIFVAIDNLTRWIEATAIPNKSATTIAWTLYKEVLTRHGVPQLLYSDKGTEFVNKVIEQLTRLNAFQHGTSIPYHPESNGLVERANQTLVSKLKALLHDSGSEWDVVLPAAVYAHRISIIQAIGRSPFELLYGRSPNIHLSGIEFPLWSKSGKDCAFKIFRDFSLVRRENSDPSTCPFKVNDLVMLKTLNPNKLDPKYVGPFPIVELGDYKTMIIQDVIGLRRVHWDQVKKIPPREDASALARGGTVERLVIKIPKRV